MRTIPPISQVLPDAYVKLLAVDGDDRRIAQRARLSFDRDDDKGWENLVRYLIEHRHDGVLEFCSMQVEIMAPLAIVQQILRHRTASFNQVSARYVALPEVDHLPPRDQWRKAPTNGVKQGSQSPEESEWAEVDLDWIEDQMAGAFVEAQDTYHGLIERGVCPEQARLVLPAARYTRLAMVANLGNWLRYLHLRLDDHAQLEHRVIAAEIAKLVQEHFPVVWEAFVEFRLEAVTFSKTEMALLLNILGGAGFVSIDEEHVSQTLGSARRAREFLAKLAQPA